MIKHFISDRFGGVSRPPYHELNIAYHVGDDPKAVEKNRRLLFQKAGIKEVVFMNQIHSCKIEYVDRICTPTCDGIITDRANLPLAVMSADCYAVLLYDASKGVIAALHAGRKGAMGGIVAKALQMMRKDFRCETIQAILSPGIGVCCYEVGEEILQTVDRSYVQGKRLDIKKMIVDQLREFGVEFYDYGVCTSCCDRYYSYRREGVTGRFASIIWRQG
jgi:YfiH family protein